MKYSVRDLVAQLDEDDWRKREGFSDDFERANGALLGGPQTPVESLQDAASQWLQKNQPCLFGRIAARKGLLHYCFLSEADLELPDEEIKQKLQFERRAWRRDALAGKRSGIIVWALSKRLAYARPGSQLQALSERLLSLYLMKDVAVDEVELDEIFLRVPRRGDDIILQWPVGINFFGAPGDKRWWHDHRIPGGIAFSMNSVGHMVKSRVLASGMKDLMDSLGLARDNDVPTRVDSLEKALELAMRTIDMAETNTPSGRATRLRNLQVPNSEPECPIPLPKNLAGKNHCTYEGRYHTDISIPTEYFDPSIRCPFSGYPHELDFTYLFHRDVDNPDHETMGDGMPIAAEGEAERSLAVRNAEARRLKMDRGREQTLDSEARDALLRDLFG